VQSSAKDNVLAVEKIAVDIAHDRPGYWPRKL
jgi:hypothetical protein